MNTESEKQITEVTFEVTIRHFVTDDSPNPDAALDIEASVSNALAQRGFDIESVVADRI